jgi:hypothetical protein
MKTMKPYIVIILTLCATLISAHSDEAKSPALQTRTITELASYTASLDEAPAAKSTPSIPPQPGFDYRRFAVRTPIALSTLIQPSSFSGRDWNFTDAPPPPLVASVKWTPMKRTPSLPSLDLPSLRIGPPATSTKAITPPWTESMPYTGGFVFHQQQSGIYLTAHKN